MSDLRQYLEKPEENVILPSNESSNPESNCGDLEENDFGLATEHLWRWCEELGGKQLLEWLPQNVNSLSPSRFLVIAAALHWWKDGREQILETAQKLVKQVPNPLYPRLITTEVKRLSALDRLLCEAGTPWRGQTKLPSSVQLAIGARQFSSIAKLLEAAGEQSSAVFIEQIAACAGVPRAEHDRARRWLCTTNDPRSVWKQLTMEQRLQWIEELTE